MSANHSDEIDHLVSRFFAVFDNRGGRNTTADEFVALFAPAAVIVSHVGREVTFSTPDDFVRPRLALLSVGQLTDFSEWETEAETECLDSLACRRSRYEKRGELAGEPYHGTGTKFFHFARTAVGWRIVALSWIDDASPASTPAP